MKMQGKTYFYVNNVVKCSMKSSLKKEGYFYHQQLFLHQDYLFLHQDYRNFTRCENRSTTTPSESLLIKNRPASTNFIEATEEIIEQNLICPLCDHKSIIALTKKEDVEYTNQQIRMNFERRMKKEWKK